MKFKQKILHFFKWIGSHKQETFVFLFLVVVASIVRFYQIDRLNFFTYDQARDALYIKRMVVDHRFRLIGTQSSIPGLYTGPAYYYLMSPFLILFGLSPAGIDFGTALFGVLSVVLVYLLVKDFTKNYLIGLFVGGWYAVAPQIVEQSRFAWNPNTTPFFVLFFVFSLLKILKNNPRWWLGVFVSLAVIIQLHYSGVCLIPVIVLFFLVYWKKIRPEKWFLVSLALFVLMMSPILLFDLRHNFVNIKAVISYGQHGTRGGIPPPFVSGSFDKLRYLLMEIPFGIRDFALSLVLSSVILFGILAGLAKNKLNREALLVVVSSLFLGILTASLYKGSFFNFYLTFMYPLGFLLLGIFLGFLFEERILKTVVWLLFILVFWTSLRKTLPLLPRKDKAPLFKSVAAVIAREAKNESEINYVGIGDQDRFDYNAVEFRYYVETFYGIKSYDWNVLDYQKAKVLYLINYKGEADPLKINTWEIGLFAPKKVTGSWKVGEAKVYKLIK